MQHEEDVTIMFTEACLKHYEMGNDHKTKVLVSQYIKLTKIKLAGSFRFIKKSILRVTKGWI